jgi:serine/threonine-protein kinase RsbW
MTDRRGAPALSLCCELASRLEEVDSVCQRVRAFLQANGRAADGFAVELLAREALNNAILHGNENQSQKNARLSLHLGRRWLRLQVTDEGAGFNWRAARHSSAAADEIHGRGLSIGALYADRMAYNQRGNQVTFWLALSGTAKRHQHGKLHA